MNTTTQTAIAKPKATLPDPDINEISKPYWDALNKGKLTFQDRPYVIMNDQAYVDLGTYK